MKKYYLSHFSFIFIILVVGDLLICFLSNYLLQDYLYQKEIIIVFNQIIIVSTAIYLIIYLVFMMSNLKKITQKIKYHEKIIEAISQEKAVMFLLFNNNSCEFASKNTFNILSENPKKLIGLTSQNILYRYLNGKNNKELVKALNEKEFEKIEIARFSYTIIKTKQNKFLKIKIYDLGEEEIVISLIDETLEEEKDQLLQKAILVAEMANQQKSRFLSDMSHDIRTPMNAIVGFSTLLMRDANNPSKIEEYSKILNSSCQYLLNLVDDVLDMGKIESGQFSLINEKFNMKNLIDESIAVVLYSLKNKNLHFNIQMNNMLNETFISDKLRISQILINVLSNCIKYTKSFGHIDFVITSLGTIKDSEQIVFQISDDGIGMDEEFVKTIFDPYTRDDKNCISGIKGTGLGMTITKNLVDLLGGKISIDSKLGVGTTFTIELKLKFVKNIEKYYKEKGINKILIIGDNEDYNNIKCLMKATEVSIHYASEVNNIKDEYDLILVDEKMVNDVIKYKTENNLTGQIIILTDYLMERKNNNKQIMGIINRPFFNISLKEILDFDKTNNKENRTSLKGLRFLVAEDNNINAQILNEFITMQGAECEIVENGEEAVKKFISSNANTYDYILMDILMPGINGYEACKIIRNSDHPDAKSIPIIALTANAFNEDIEKAKKAGMNGHISKPINLEIFKNTILKINK